MVTPQYVVAFSKNYTSNRGSGVIVSIEKIARSGPSLRGRRSEVGRSVPGPQKPPAYHLPDSVYESYHEQNSSNSLPPSIVQLGGPGRTALAPATLLLDQQ
jgi:hypothetical protein